ncbi:hypothetical protein ACQCSX_13175 [Pseudarthrobacter sp. P1]|uniref:hypothetical protein n=1 Tax=Pseudarthrobacter sp. P1 TaxID=3418418 RepID=UPI003CE8A975
MTANPQSNDRTHLDSIFELNVFPDSDDDLGHRILEFAVYPMLITSDPGTATVLGGIDTKHLLALRRVAVDSLCLAPGEVSALVFHDGWLTIGFDAECWTPADVEILFGQKLGNHVMAVLTAAHESEWSGVDQDGIRYRSPKGVSRRNLMRCKALQKTLSSR